MKFDNFSLTSLDLSASAASEAFYVGSIALFAVQVVASGGGTPAGTFKLQASCDPGLPSAGTRTLQANGVTNWTDISGASDAITDDGVSLFNVADPGYTFVRVVWTRTSGTGTGAIRVHVKGV
jgi:hypothetical protein